MGNIRATTHSKQHAARLIRQANREDAVARAERTRLIIHYTGVAVFLLLAIAYGTYVLWYIGGSR